MPVINKFYFKLHQFFSTRFPRTYGFCDGRKSVIKFFIAGSLAGATDLIFLFIFHGLFYWGVVLSTSLAFILSFLVSFTLQKFWTFRNYSQEKFSSQLILYLLNAFIGLNLNGWLMHFLVSKHHIWYMLAQIIVSLAVGFYNFLVYKYIIFKLGRDEISHQQKTTRSDAGDLA